MRLLAASLVLFTTAAFAGISEAELRQRSEIVCENDVVLIGINVTEKWLFHKDTNKEEGWEGKIGKLEKSGNCDHCYDIEAFLPVPYQELPFPVPLTVWAKTRTNSDRQLVLNYEFGLGKPQARVENIVCRTP